LSTLKTNLTLSLVDRVSAPARAIGATLAGLDKRMSGFRAFTARVGQFAAIGAGYFGATAGIDGTVGAARRLEAQLSELGIKAGLSDGQLAQLQRRLTALSAPTNQLTTDLLAGVDTMVGLGLSAEQAVAAIPAIGKAATATGADMTDLAAAATSAMQNLKIRPEEIGRLLDSLAAAGNAGAFELRDQAEYLPALGATYQALGQTGVAAATDIAAALQIVRTGTGDSASAATNLQNVLQKVNAPQTRAAFKKMGVNLQREMTKASKRGMTPLEALAEVTNRTLKGDLSKLGDLFQDAQVQQGLRPLIQQLEEYRRIRAEAGSATGTVDASYDRRMQTADARLKGLRIRIENAGTAIGSHLLKPIADAAEYLANVFDTLDQRVTVFDKIGVAVRSFLAGLGVDIANGGALKQIRDFVFGVQTDGRTAGEELGRLAAQFRGYGEAIKANPLAAFLLQVSSALAVLALSRWGRVLIVAYGISALIGAASGAGSLEELSTNLKALSTVEWVGIGAGLTMVTSRVRGLVGAVSGLLGLLGRLSPYLAMLSLSGDAPTDGKTPDWQADPRADRWKREALEQGIGPANRTKDDDAWVGKSRWERDVGTTPGTVERPLHPSLMNENLGRQSSLSDPIGALRTTILQTRQQGVADVRVTNAQRPNLTIYSPVTVSVTKGESNSQIAAYVEDQIGKNVKAALNASYSDGPV